jgi:hypothetical protein
MSAWTAAALAAATRHALGLGSAQLRAAQEHASAFTWERTTRQSRAAVIAAARSARHAQVGR